MLHPSPHAAAGVRPEIRASRNAPRRAAVLILVHILIAAHITHWLLTGSTLTPVEPSESMQTLERGLINAGAIFFGVAILATLIFGRFFCGWGCHIVALQDLCALIMKRLGVRPKPFRSRTLVYIPLLLALWMFIWPTFKREALAPALRGVWPGVDAALGVTPFPDQGFTPAFFTEGFWDTFPSWGVAVPFLLICGFASVYFLGAKGFCTYGCPYGGFFAPADLVAPGRIIVDHDKCHACGHCTAVCTSNVRVHDEIRAYGMVVDPGCMKCMDCVSVCPNGALSFGFAKPAVVKGTPRGRVPKRVYDTSLREDALLAGVFAAIFFCTRGAYGLIPMLMAVGIAGCGAFIYWNALKCAREANVRHLSFQLKRSGRLTNWGRVFMVLCVVLAGITLHTGAVNFQRWRGERVYDELALPKERVLLPGMPPLAPEAQALAKKAIAHYERAVSIGHGGWGLFHTPSADLRLAFLHLAIGEPERAQRLLERAGAGRPLSDEGTADLGRVMLLRGDAAGAMALYERALAADPANWSTREVWALIMAQSGRAGDALRETDAALAHVPAERFTRTAHARTRIILSRLKAATGDGAGALEDLRRAAEVRPADPFVRESLAAGLAQITGDLHAAVAEMREAVRLAPQDARRRFQLGTLLVQTGQGDLAEAEFGLLESRGELNADQRAAVGVMFERSGDAARAQRWRSP